MAIGVVSDSEFANELAHSEKSPVPELRPAQVKEIPKPGRSEGDNNVPDSLRKIIGEEAVINGRASALEFAKMVGISDSSVSAYTGGKNSTSATSKNNKLAEHLRGAKLRVANRARRRLNAALENLTDDKLSECKAVELATVAKSMSGIIKDMEPAAESVSNTNTFNGPSIVLYNPGFTKEDRFESLEANE